MKNFKLRLLFYFLYTINTYSFSQNLPAPFKIIPQPQKILLAKTAGLQISKLGQMEKSGDFKSPILGKNLSKLVNNKAIGKGKISLILDQYNSQITNNEGYIMNITNSNVQITAKSEAGLFYGCQSLEQLIEDALAYNKPIPACVITDSPTLAYRAVHFDVKHHLDHLNYYYDSIDRLARYKINAIVFEYEDKLGYEKQPEVASPQAISLEEMTALTQYARERFIEITPLVQGLGHASFILKHEKYAALRELKYNTWAFCPKDEGTYTVLFDLYSDAIKATPGSKYLHIGGDEIGNIGLCPRCKPTADKEGMMAINLYWLKRVCAFAKENNRIPIFWDDMPLQHAGLYETTWSDEVSKETAQKAWAKGTASIDSLLADFPKNCVYMRWNYSMAHQPGNIMAMDWYKSCGLNAMVATATNTEGGMLIQQDDRENKSTSLGVISIKSFLELASEKSISGMLCTAWDDKSPHMENYWRGFIAAAEYSWSPKKRNLDEFDEAWLQKEFGLKLPDYKEFHAKLRKGSELFYEAFYKNGNIFDDHNQLQSMKRVEHWLKPQEGTENIAFDYTTKLIDLPNLQSPGQWTEKYQDKLVKAEIEANNYASLSNKLKNLGLISKKNKYYWELSLALYNLQNTASELLLALKQSDNLDLSKQKAGKMAVGKAIQNFDKTWAELNKVYSKTRYTKYPSNYVPDRYFHLASQKEDLTWMIQAQELYHAKIKNWLVDLKN